MKNNYFQIIKFTTILKKINRFKEKFSRIYRNIEFIPSYFTNVFRLIPRLIFSKINKSVIFIIRDLFNLFRSIKYKIKKNIEVFFASHDYDKNLYLEINIYNQKSVIKNFKEINYKNNIYKISV